MTPTKGKYFVLAVFFVSPVVFAQPANLNYSDIKRAIVSSYTLRKELLDYSAGKVFLKLDNKQVDPKEKKKMSEQLGIDEDKINLYSGHGEWSIEWYNKGTTKRYDMLSKELVDKNIHNFIEPFNKRIVATPENAIYYNVNTKEAYINAPPKLAKNASALIHNFDIDYLYNPSCLGSAQKCLDNLELKNWPMVVEKDIINGQECVKIEFTSNRKEIDPKLGWIPRNLVQLWVCPEMSYSLVRYRNMHNSFLDLKEDKLVLYESYDATYEESKGYPGVWVLKNMSRYEGAYPLKETLVCEFEGTEVGVELPQEKFTFDGLGVPVGTRLYDKTLGGRKPFFYYYKSFPIGEFDSLIKDVKVEMDSGVFIPQMDIALKNKRLYIYNLNNGDFIQYTDNINSDEAQKYFQKDDVDFIAWQKGFIVNKRYNISMIKDDKIHSIKRDETKYNQTFSLPEEFELPLNFLLEKSNSSKIYLLVINKIEKDGIWIRLSQGDEHYKGYMK